MDKRKPFGGTAKLVRGTAAIGPGGPNHLLPDSHPFEISGTNGGRGSSKHARMLGLGPNPGGSGNMISANASMKKRRPLNGPGNAT